jgi:hypothetical protein
MKTKKVLCPLEKFRKKLWKKLPPVDRTEDQALTIEPGGGAFPFTVIWDVPPDLLPPEHIKTFDSDKQIQRPIMMVMDASKAIMRQDEYDFTL